MSHDRSKGQDPARRYSVSLQQAAAAVFGAAVVDAGTARQEQMNGAARAPAKRDRTPGA